MRNLMGAFGLLLAMTMEPSVLSPQESELDLEEFVQQLNEHLQSEPGVTVRKVVEPPDFSYSSIGSAFNYETWAANVANDPPPFGLVVTDAGGHPYDMLGKDVPYYFEEDRIFVPGYQLPEGGMFKVVGSAQWTETAQQIASEARNQAPNEDILMAVNTISNASDYIASELCATKARPTKLVLNLTAGFQLVFNAQTGSQVEWDLELVCPRYQ